ncbi:MAG: ATP synthase F1 subunit delta [SAR202 cluster bacterium]|nr:ATP synthase F1 subunit delta [SAR202 cluster bacterium]
MPRSVSAKRYAQAIFQLALEQNSLDHWSEDLRVLASIISEGNAASHFDAPGHAAEKNVEAVRAALGDAVSPLAVNLLALLSTRGLAGTVPDILDEYSKFVDTHRGIEQATVITAVPLKKDEAEKLAAILKGIIGKEIKISTVVDPSILGGIIARVGDRVIDGSVRTRLSDMRRELVG